MPSLRSRVSLPTSPIRSLRLLAVVLALLTCLITTSVPAAKASQSTSGGWTWTTQGTAVQLDTCCSPLTWYSGATRSTTLPSGLEVSVGVTGNVYLSATDQLMSARGGANGQFFSNGIVSSTGVQLATTDDRVGCTYGTLCTNRGVINVTFSRSVTNPVVSITGLGGGASDGATSGSKTVTWTELTLTTPSVTAQGLTTANLTVSNNRIEPTTKNPSPNCSSNNTTYATTANAACGSIRLVGSGTSFSFTADLGSRCNTVCYTGPSDIEDGWTMIVSVDEDFGLAPSSYDTSPTSHVIGPLHMGASVVADQTSTINPSTNPDSVAAGANITTIDDGTTAFSGTVAFTPGGTFTANVALTGVTASSILCGWIDFNANGTFDNASERTCASPTAGDSAAALVWNVPSTVSSSVKYARLRLSLDQAANNPVGRVASGEVEDYSFTSSIGSPGSPTTVTGPPTTVAQSTTTVVGTNTLPGDTTPPTSTQVSNGSTTNSGTTQYLPTTGSDMESNTAVAVSLVLVVLGLVALRRRSAT